jgi:hypothetical protein
MWEHGGSLKYVPQDANLNFGHLDYHDLGKHQLGQKALEVY